MRDVRDMSRWNGAARVEPLVLEGRYARLEPLDPGLHARDLFASAVETGAESRFRYLLDVPPRTLDDVVAWTVTMAASRDPMFFAVVKKADGRAHGRQSLMRIDPANGVVEIGHILWGPGIARSRVATEALYLSARHVFERLGYRRFEWKCDTQNMPSRRAATRFGFYFEGVFRQHMVVKGRSRDTAWFAMTDKDWPRLKPGYESWLQPGNFDAHGQQRRKLEFDPPA
jgi:RimJ/RimL family protein N-acetyltransferase